MSAFDWNAAFESPPAAAEREPLPAPAAMPAQETAANDVPALIEGELLPAGDGAEPASAEPSPAPGAVPRFATAEDGVAWMNAQIATVNLSGQVRIARSTKKGPEFMAERDAALFFRNLSVPVPRTGQGGATVCDAQLFDLWLKSPKRRTYDSVGFLFTDEERIANPRTFNLWRGWGVEPTPGDSRPLRAYISEILADGDAESARYIEGWCAHGIRHPGECIGTALVIHGRGRIGKSFLGELLGRVYGAHSFLASSGDRITGQFSGHFENTLLLRAEEAVWSGDRRARGRLFSIINSPTIDIEHKGQTPRVVPNRIKAVVTTNDEHAAEVKDADERFAVFSPSERRMGDTRYFGQLWQQAVHEGGLAAWLHIILEEYDAQAAAGNPFNPRQIPETHARQQQRIKSLDWLDRFLLDQLFSGKWWRQFDGAIQLGTVVHECEEYLRRINRLGYEDASRETIGRRLAGLGAENHRVREGGQLVYRRQLPALREARDKFAANRRLGAVDWDAFSDAEG